MDIKSNPPHTFPLIRQIRKVHYRLAQPVSFLDVQVNEESADPNEVDKASAPFFLSEMSAMSATSMVLSLNNAFRRPSGNCFLIVGVLLSREGVSKGGEEARGFLYTSWNNFNES